MDGKRRITKQNINTAISHAGSNTTYINFNTTMSTYLKNTECDKCPRLFKP